MHFQLLTITIISFFTSINGQLSNLHLNLNNDLKAKLSAFSTPSPLAALGSLVGENTINSPCSCAVFMSGQFRKGSPEPPKGHPALIQETEFNFPCTPAGTKMCINKCLESIVKHLPNSSTIICGTIDRDCHRERAYLFTQHCDGKSWINSNLSAGREFCCKNGSPVSCLGASST